MKNNLKKKFEQKWSHLQKKIKNLKEDEVSSWILNNTNLVNKYSSKAWFYLEQIEKYLFFTNSLPLLSKDDTFHSMDEEVFDLWNNSEFAHIFLQHINSQRSIQEATELTLQKMRKHLIHLGERHLKHKLILNYDDYVPQNSLGDFVKNKKLTFLHSDLISLPNLNLKIFGHSINETKKFKDKIEKALLIIATYSPLSFQNFITFTEAIIPIKNTEFVSYSHQELPGYSMINLYDRDFVDLMDDLIHENGHHHLNCYLNQKHLFDENPELNYYSPWRRTLRPIRGIFHAYLTFIWAFKLFTDLTQNSLLYNHLYRFSKKEIAKIRWRVIEEYYMLNYSFIDLKIAKDKQIIKESGWKLISQHQQTLDSYQKWIHLIERDLGLFDKDLKNLKKELRSAELKFQSSRKD